MNIPNRVIQALFDAATNSNTDIMRWSTFLAVIEELRNTTTSDYTANPPKISDLPVYNSDAAASSLASGTLYRTTTGEVRVKLGGGT